MWFILDPERLKREVEGIERLSTEVEWLSSVKPRVLPGIKFAVDLDVLVDHEIIPLTLTYPNFFPQTPPSILPRDGKRHSSHQWGEDGELCLEYRTDNWDPSVTGVMMVESAYRLFSGEHPANNQLAVVPSAHHASLGQRLRGSSTRGFSTPGLRAQISNLQTGFNYPCSVSETSGPKRTWAAYVASIGPKDMLLWQEDIIPAGVGHKHVGTLVRVPAVKEISITSQENLDEVVGKAIITEPVQLDQTSRFTVLADLTTVRYFFSYLTEGVWKVIAYHTIEIAEEPSSRLPAGHATLACKKVGIVGCGSLGSKIAVSLARSGVRNFLLIDDDILSPGNLVRNELGAESLGVHKVEALEERLLSVAPGVEVSVSRVHLGGQEASGSTAAVLENLALCDLIIDATADAQAFNFIASVARRSLKPMLWAEVYAGGIGGFVARVRPDIEPPPHTARRQYLAWCRDQGVPWLADAVDYSAEIADDVPPLIADDSDVGVIAAHAARMAVDVLVKGPATDFPHPAYAIGLSAEWIFTEPFDTRPVDFTPEGEWRSPLVDGNAKVALEYLTKILESNNAN
ncbi:ThiF family adenylyltransferase [Rhizobium sp. VS19-DR104.2]|uniref:ThiF family adenylyltransferase n=1 Tax=unclassified Rhizobium TaxID=2613769 RepID=UPI001C5B3ACA|nr:MULTISPECIES: ThiF family adenylyltransferase [unclassified Rhizobium]MBZ5762069.1 ThiF family adenylyltransferase [Rhizobium sp. VS19-DR96]MBZ5768182.1 ThiF family adenylyltransferase [Rhizobium sp. VS19-DR129.2]MBZ5775753.1 ThiF family adenylyltransferase [Rhizobium sp. VS19-DRK62.2]MBZ5786946.1 ThiF family adenylyltransferase [Rhizobium sp. VS19-DR121]MBZ5804107.1 ThiF family adenylyltransferase [Rhizobium sp. VS19-DR181]